jgi:hypothetical protein
MVQVIAPRTQYLTCEASREIVSTGGITIFGFIVSNKDTTNARTIRFRDKDGSSYLEIYMPAGSNFSSEVWWRPDDGLTISTDTNDADVVFTLFRSSNVT